MNKIFLLSVAILQVFNTYAQKTTSFKYDSSLVSIGGNQLQIYIAGKGNNTIVFESGLGVDGKTWFTNDIFQTFAKHNQVIAYNRAGYFPSTLSDEPRAMQQLANDLAELIRLRSAHSKVILVGHSLGAAIVRTFAVQHPGKVKALLLIDPNHEKFTPYANITQAVVDTFVSQFSAFGNKGAAMEAKELINNISFLKSLSNLPDVPVTVLTSSKQDDGQDQKEIDDWVAAHASLGAGVKKFTHIKTSKSGHFIYEEEPELVISNLQKLLK